MIAEILKFSRKKARLFLLEVLSEEGHLTWDERLNVVEDSLDALDQKCQDNRASLREFVGCGHHTEEYGRQ